MRNSTYLKIIDTLLDNGNYILACSLVTSKTFQISRDVDVIYNKYFKKTIEKIKSNKPLIEKSSYIDSDKLVSNICKKAHEQNPVTIVAAPISNMGNFYAPSKSIIHLSFNKNVVNLIRSKGGYDNAIKSLPEHQVNSFIQEFSLSTMKASIAHELSHWIQDSLHNRHINKKLKIAKEKGFGNIDVSTPIELDAQIHNFRQLYRKYWKSWDTLSFVDVFKLNPALLSVIRVMIYNKNFKEWLKKFILRLNREGLLGEKMRKININTIKKELL